LDWRRQFEERPLTMLAAALGGGMLLAALIPGGGNGRRPRAYAEASTRSEGRREAEARARKTEPESDGSLDTLKGAFMTVAASRIGGFLGQLLAGYRAETARAKRAQRYSAR